MKPIVTMVFFFTILLASCTPRNSIQPRSPARALDSFDSLIIGSTTEAEVLQRWGEPTMKLPTSKGTTWLYCDPSPCSSGRPSLFIEPTTHVVKAASWDLRPEDGDISFKNISSRYPQAHFIQKQSTIQNKDLIERFTIWSAPEAGIVLNTIPGHPDSIQTIRKTFPAK